MNSKSYLKLKKKVKYTYAAFIFALIIIVVFMFSNNSFSELENDVEVRKNTELTYYLKVSYDGVDKNGVKSNDTTLSDINSGVMYVEDKLPEGLTFKGFVTTEDGTIGAVKRGTNYSCVGKVIDDTNDASLTEGTWNAGNTEYTYHGLHYNAETRTVSFKVKNLKAGCDLTVGIITQTPETIDDPLTPDKETRRDFYNFATARERDLTKNSNTVHVFMGSEFATLHSVTYQLTGTVPENVPGLPLASYYTAGAKVGVAADLVLDGYSFSGWTTSDATITDGVFTMPEGNVVLTGSFTAVQRQSTTVNYSITGTTPDGYVLPTSKNYFVDSIQSVDSLKAGDIINGYRFLGWTSTDVQISEDGDFTVPVTNPVSIVGSFEEVTYSVRYQFYDTVLPENADSYLPATQEYSPGDTVTLANVTSEPAGYKFMGWYKESTFTMPEEDVVVYGEWKAQNGTFAPGINAVISSTPLNSTVYYSGEIVTFYVTITNSEAFDITDVYVKSDHENAIFVSDDDYDYEILSDHVAKISSIPSGTSFRVKATYTVGDSDVGSVECPFEVVGAVAADDYVLTDQEIKDSATFNVSSKIIICQETPNTSVRNTFRVHITSTNSDYWVVLNQNTCKAVNVSAGTYTILEVIPQEFTLDSVTGSITENGGTISVVDGTNYDVTFKNSFVKKGFFHSFGRVKNTVIAMPVG